MIDIDLSIALKNEGTTYSYEYHAVPDLGNDIDFEEPLQLRSEYCVDDKCVRVFGTLATVLCGPCDRCLKETAFAFGGEFDELFVPEGKQNDDEYTYRGEKLCLDKMVYDIIMLGMPHQLLCSENCKGLCPKCGQDLNRAQCSCEKNDTDETSPFAKLKGLF